MAKSNKKTTAKKATAKPVAKKEPVNNTKNIKEAEKTSETTSEPVSDIQAMVGPEDMEKLSAASVNEPESNKEEEEVKQETGDEESTETPAEEGTEESNTPEEQPEEENKETPKVVKSVGCPVPSYPVDRYGFTTDIRKAVAKGVSKAKVHHGRHDILLDTLREALAFAEAAIEYAKGRKK